MKTAISLPDPVFAQAESLAQELGVSRSELYTNALKDYLLKHNQEQRLHKLTEVYAEESSLPDLILTEMQMQSLSREDW